MPDNAHALANNAYIYQAHGDLPAASAILVSANPPASSPLFWATVNQWIYERRYANAMALLKPAVESPDPALAQSDKLNFKDTLAWLYQLSGDTAKAHTMWQQVGNEVEKCYHDDPENVGTIRWLASLNAELGDEAKAFSL